MPRPLRFVLLVLLLPALAPTYPNPARAAVTVPFQLAEPGKVRIAVYDLLGREVAILVDEVFEAGSYEVAWAEASALAAGVYLVQFEAGSTSRTQRLTLVR